MRVKSDFAVLRAGMNERIRTAIWVSYHPQMTGNPRPQGYRSCMPEYVKDYFESYGNERAKAGRAGLTNEDIDIHDAVHAAMASSTLTVAQRELLWAASVVPWKKLLRQMYDVPERTLKRRRGQALMLFAVSYARVMTKPSRLAA